MIATVTLNPAVDYTVSLQNPLQKNAVNRTEKEQLTPGGKGINVSLILHRLGIPTTAHGFLAGFTGTLIDEAIRSAGIPAQWIRSTDSTQMNRINLKLVEQDAVTEFNGAIVYYGDLTPDEVTALRTALGIAGVGGHYRADHTGQHKKADCDNQKEGEQIFRKYAFQHGCYCSSSNL